MDSDAYLHNKGLRTFDPYAQKDLLPLEKQKPDPDSLDIRNRYVVGSEKIFCHICGSRRHNNGFTGIVSEGAAILFGSTCAKDYFCEETLRQAELAFEDQEKTAYAEFNIRKQQGTASEMNRWILKYRSTIKFISDAWDILLTDHQETVEEIFAHLEKNNYRLTEEFEEEATQISRAIGRNERIVSRRVVCAIRNVTSIKDIRDFSKHFKIVSYAVSALLELRPNATQEELVELSERLRTNFSDSLDKFESVVRFSVEFFQEPTFSQVCNWSDRQRALRLRRAQRISPRNLARTLRRKLGDGYELPRPMLQEIIGTDDFLVLEDNKMRKTSGQV